MQNDTAVGYALGEAVVKTAQASKAPRTSPIKQDDDYMRMQVDFIGYFVNITNIAVECNELAKF